jgi:hypothetical protein
MARALALRRRVLQHGEKDGAFEIEREFPLAGQFANHAPATGLPPQPFEGEGRAELAGHHFGGLAPLVGGQHYGTMGKARARAQQAYPDAASESDLVLGRRRPRPPAAETIYDRVSPGRRSG